MGSKPNEAFPHKQALEESLGAMRSLADNVRDLLTAQDARIVSSMTSANDDEICYIELWMKQLRDRLKELDKKIGSVRQLNWKRAMHLWYTREESTRMYGHIFRLSFHFIPSLPKAGTKERHDVIAWLKAGNRMDCLVMDEHTGEWVFDFDKMEELVNAMLSDGQRPPDAIKLHPQVKIDVRAER